jgi:hypothetical protein
MPQPIALEDQTLAGNEVFKSFPDQDALAKGYLDLKTRVDGGSIDLLPEDLRKDTAISPFKNVNDLARSYVETKKLVGGIKKAPETPEGYKFTQLQNLHPNLKAENVLKPLMPLFHKAGIHNEAADQLQQGILTLLSQANAQSDQAKKDLAAKNETALRAEWGDKYDTNIDRVTKVLQRAAGKDAKIETDALAVALKDAPTALRALERLTSLLSEDSIGKLDVGATPQQVNDKQAAMAEIERLKLEYAKDPNGNPIVNAKHPEHEKAWGEWNRLHALLN